MTANKGPGRDAEPNAGGPMRTEGNAELVFAASVPPVPAALTPEERRERIARGRAARRRASLPGGAP